MLIWREGSLRVIAIIPSSLHLNTFAKAAPHLNQINIILIMIMIMIMANSNRQSAKEGGGGG